MKNTCKNSIFPLGVVYFWAVYYICWAIPGTKCDRLLQNEYRDLSCIEHHLKWYCAPIVCYTKELMYILQSKWTLLNRLHKIPIELLILRALSIIIIHMFNILWCLSTDALCMRETLNTVQSNARFTWESNQFKRLKCYQILNYMELQHVLVLYMFHHAECVKIDSQTGKSKWLSS